MGRLSFGGPLRGLILAASLAFCGDAFAAVHPQAYAQADTGATASPTAAATASATISQTATMPAAASPAAATSAAATPAGTTPATLALASPDTSAPAPRQSGGVDPSILAALAGDDSDAKQQAILSLGTSTDPSAAIILSALSAGTLYVDGASHVLIGVDADQARDVQTGSTMAMPADASAIVVNNRLRRAIETAQAGSQLFSKNSSTRLDAAQRLQQGGTPAQLALVNRALQAEQDAGVRAALTIAVASLELKTDDPAVRRHAVTLLGQTESASFRATLVAMQARHTDGSYAEPDASVREAASLAVARIDRHQSLIAWVGNLFFGLSLGSVLLLAALGLSITFGLMGVINMAHGELLMLGAYATYVVQRSFQAWLPGHMEWYLVAALPVAFVFTAVVGMLLERTVIRWLYGRPLETLLATWGISLMLMQAVRTVFGAQNVEVGNPDWMSGGVTVLGGLVLTYNRIVIIVFAILVVFFVWLLLNHTRLGLFVRAITQNRRMADCVGVPTGRIDMLAFGLGSGIAGLAGVALSQLGNVGPDLGRSYIVDSFMVVVLGGVGQLAGTVIAAMGLGTVNKFLEPYSGPVLAKIVILVLIVLIVQKRPQGLFAPRGRSAND